MVAVAMLLMLTALVVSGWLAVRESSERVSHERQALAQATGNYLDYILRQNLERLDNIRFAQGVDIEDNDPGPEKRELHSVYLGSIFNGGVFITDETGTVLWSEPFNQDFVGADISGYPPIAQSLNTGRPLISDVLTTKPADQKTIFMVTPLRNREGKMAGLVGGQIDPAGRTFQDFTRPIALGGSSYIDIIDSKGVVLASSNPQRVLGRGQDSANPAEAEVTELARLSGAPWSVALRQPEREALAPVRTMRERFIIFGLSSLVIALLLSWGMARSLVKPLGQLTSAARGISRGDLSLPIPQLGDDEIGQLSRSFDTMRSELKKSLDESQNWNKELEARVEERTRQLEESFREIEAEEAARGELLRKVLTAQEEERKRIARELHDETSQSVAGMVMKLEAALAASDSIAGKTRSILTDTRNLAIKTIDNLHKIIFDLRPSVLDDLGLLSAIRWYAESRLGSLDIKVRVEVTGSERKLPQEKETVLFRVVQEALTNIARHAQARNVVLSVEFEDSVIRIEVEDDGEGFDVNAVRLKADKTRGLGLLGMKERVALLEGKLLVESEPGSGTHITIEVPVNGRP
ncbi:MAG: HAMP domain-containing protein [Chloroflexi bacterium]|nr:HAMP domain-containing protein [Chloroflexota bacterium]